MSSKIQHEVQPCTGMNQHEQYACILQYPAMPLSLLALLQSCYSSTVAAWCCEMLIAHSRVEYFGQRMEGFVFTEHGWVQSYGSRYVRPPIIHGDVSRPHAMTTKEFQYAQSLTQKPVKGMLTGKLLLQLAVPSLSLLYSCVSPGSPTSVQAGSNRGRTSTLL